jgi:sulfite exporter TauE/SafE
VIYLGLCISTFTFVTGASRTSQKRQQQTWTARFMHHGFGRWLVGAVGIVIVVIGLYLVFEGITRRFEKQLKLGEMSRTTRRAVVAVGAAGTAARGVVFAVTGVLVVAAAVTYDPKKSSGLDGAMRTLADRPYGPWLLSALAIGLIAFGAFGFAEARWARTQ